MATFYVGQRVRINCPFSVFHGLEATVISPLVWDWCMTTGRFLAAHAVDIDGHGSFDTADGIGFALEPHELIPLTDPGRELVTWESMEGLWTPEQVPA